MRLYDVSLRRIGLSITDRLVAARRLDALGVTFVDGGRPGRWFYARAAIELRLRAATLVASGGAQDLTALLAAETPVVTMVVQGHGFSVLREAVRQLVRAERRVIVGADGTAARCPGCSCTPTSPSSRARRRRVVGW